MLAQTGASGNNAESGNWVSDSNVWGSGSVQWMQSQFAEPALNRDAVYGDNTESHLNDMRGGQQWLLPDTEDQSDRLETQTVTEEVANTVKLRNVVPPIRFASGRAQIPPEYVGLLRDLLNSMQERANVRLHFVGHSDDQSLSPELRAQYTDNLGLSRARAGFAAEFFKDALRLPAESISYEGLGESQPVASNRTVGGRAENRRVEVEVWYDEISEEDVEKEVLVQAQMNRIKVCRVETVCKLRYQEGHDRRAKVKNLVAPLRYDPASLDITPRFEEQLLQALNNLRGKTNVVVRFIGHTDNALLTGHDASIYGNHLAISRARARRVALAMQERLGLAGNAIDSDGYGSTRPVASNETEKGRMLNRRIEVEFWYDDPLQALPDEPQMCPEQAGAETLTKVYNPPSGDIQPIYFNDGKPQLPAGFSQRLQRLMGEVSDKAKVRLRFTGYLSNERLERRTAAVYGDDIGLSTARARRVMQQVRTEITLNDEQAEFLGKGYVQADDVVNAGFVDAERSWVKVEVVYEELALLDDLENLDITRITREVTTQNPYALNLMRITVDGKPLHDPGKSVADVQRCTDVALDRAKIHFRHDNLEFKPRLNVSAWPATVRYNDDFNTSVVENKVTFKLYSNYRSMFERAEVRLFEAGESNRSEPLAVIELNEDGEGEWLAEFEDIEGTRKHLNYLLRVYDADGRFDQTQAQSLWVVNAIDSEQLQAAERDRELLVGYGENRLAEQNIPLNGGTIQVLGEGIPEGHTIWVAGRPVPMSDGQGFVAEELLPKGLHTVEVAVLDEQGNGELFQRDLQFKKNDWFYVGIADLTIATDDTNGPAELVTQEDGHYDNDLSIDGRLAFFTRGNFGDDWKLTASADTREGPVDELFTNFTDKTAEGLFRRMDPDYYYPTFGDDSTVEEGAPTLGKFYVKVEKDKNYGLWGNFDSDYTDNSLTLVDRTLYGINGHYESDDLTEFGEERMGVDGFFADPGTIASRDEFRGTGGSLYYLRHQDITQGSENIRVEVRDRDSGLVLGVKNLVHGLDYDIDYIQGRIVLTQPLSASYANDMLINSDGGEGSEVFLVSRYEYTPGFDELDTMALGGEAHYWVNDNWRVGITAYSNEADEEEGSLGGANLTWRKSTSTWVKVEAAQTDGAGVETLNSADGGFTFGENSITDPDASASGYRIDSSVALSDVDERLTGQMTVYMQELEAGYSAPGLQTDRDTQQYGGTLAVPLTESATMRGKLDVREQDMGLETTATEVDVDYKLSEQWTLSSGVRYDERTDNSPVVAVTQEEGERADLRVQAGYDPGTDWTTYGFVQGTVTSSGTRDENNRAGVGGTYQVTEKLSLLGEISGGDLGTLGSIGTDYLMSDRTSVYTNYVVENERSDNGLRAQQGNLVSGFRTRYSDSASVYMEERYTHGDVPSGLTHTAGIDLAPNERWNYGANLDIATLKDSQTAAQTERTALGGRVGYRFDKTTVASALEYRVDDSEAADTGITSERKTWLSKNSLKVQMSEDWRLIGKLNMSESTSSLGEFYDGNYTEAVMGYAYRPVSHDRLNALVKYTYFYNMPTTDQVTVSNTAAQYVQKSHVISTDVIYDLTTRWSLGAKYAYRRGELSLDREDPEFFRSDASLYILRADWHVLHHWDLLMEARLLDLPDAQDQRSGMLVGIYRHFGDNLKVGVGYNATDFSDDLTDLSYDSKGMFINAVGKF
ncbi:OmpA family protein [Pseudomaricurvus sp. HS19]|uniref:OmpA family protein n=1 Tax=Pseudomaricurvus sp. HS19 TaxID=2692626 RepID=UPI0013711EEB|nr:OmpA family protein [Pseudomaricurvus sp. HS19]